MTAAPPPWLAQLRAQVLARVQAREVTQAALAGHLGITQRHLCAVLSGKATGSPELLSALAQAMGLRIEIATDGAPARLPLSRQARRRRRRLPE